MINDIFLIEKSQKDQENWIATLWVFIGGEKKKEAETQSLELNRRGDHFVYRVRRFVPFLESKDHANTPGENHATEIVSESSAQP